MCCESCLKPTSLTACFPRPHYCRTHRQDAHMETLRLSCLCRTHYHTQGRFGSCRSLSAAADPCSCLRIQACPGRRRTLKYLAKGSVPNDRCDPLFEPDGQILDPLEWIAKLTLHIPDQGAQTIRYCGRYSNVSRGKAAKRALPP